MDESTIYRESDRLIEWRRIHQYVAVKIEHTSTGLLYYYAWGSGNSVSQLKEQFSHYGGMRYITVDELFSMPVLPQRIIYVSDGDWDGDKTHLEIMWGGSKFMITFDDDNMKIIGWKEIVVEREAMNSIRLSTKS